MTEHAAPILYTLALWWLSTGVILVLGGLPRASFRWSLLGATVVLAGALWGLEASSRDATPWGAFTAFTCALLAWGWHEVSFLLGYVTGPRTVPCSKGSSGWQRFGEATQTLIYHELAILVTAALVLALTWHGDNQVGLWTFLILWVMRLSAKLNLFLGVPNTAEEMLPAHLAHLKSFFRRRRMNLLFPVSVLGSSAVLVLLVQAGLAHEASAFEAVGLTFLATLLTLAVIEHWFLVLPLPVAALWGMRSRVTPGASAPHHPA